MVGRKESGGADDEVGRKTLGNEVLIRFWTSFFLWVGSIMIETKRGVAEHSSCFHTGITCDHNICPPFGG